MTFAGWSSTGDCIKSHEVLLPGVLGTTRSRRPVVNLRDGERGVDPDLFGEFGGPGRARREALRTGGVRGGENRCAFSVGFRQALPTA